MAHKISIKVLNVESAEYLHPAHHTIQLRFADQSWLVIDKWKDWDIFKPVIEYAEDPANNFRIIPFGEKARLEDERLRAIAKEEAEKLFKAEKIKEEEAKKNHIQVPAEVPAPKPEPVVAAPVVEAPQPELPLPTLETPPAPSVPEPIAEAPVVAVVNAESAEKPTVAVAMPEVIAPIMQAEVVNVVPEMSVTSPEPQVEIKLTPVETVTAGDVVAQVETLPAEAANIVVTVTPEDEAKLKDAGVSVVDVVEKALDESPAVTLPEKVDEVAVEAPVVQPERIVEEPVPTVAVVLDADNPNTPTVAVTMPEVVTPIIQAEVTNVVPVVNNVSIDPQVEIKLIPVEAVQPDAVVTQAETVPAEVANIAVAISPTDEQKLKDAGIEITHVVEDAVFKVDPGLPPKAEEIKEVPVVEAAPVAEAPTPEVLPDAVKE